MSKKLLETPVEGKIETGTRGDSAATYNGEPGLPQRSSSKDGVDEVTYNNFGEKK